MRTSIVWVSCTSFIIIIFSQILHFLMVIHLCAFYIAFGLYTVAGLLLWTHVFSYKLLSERSRTYWPPMHWTTLVILILWRCMHRVHAKRREKNRNYFFLNKYLYSSFFNRDTIFSQTVVTWRNTILNTVNTVLWAQRYTTDDVDSVWAKSKKH